MIYLSGACMLMVIMRILPVLIRVNPHEMRS
jgi:hypothetical protein